MGHMHTLSSIVTHRLFKPASNMPSTILYRVQACYDAVLSLQRSPLNSQATNTDRIQIILATSSSQGQNSLIIFIKADGSRGEERLMQSPNLLSCKSFRHLWLGWRVSGVPFCFNDGMIL